MANNNSYTKTAKFVHWTMALIWILVWCMGMLAVYGREFFNPNYILTYWHKAIASTLLFLVVIRIIWRLTHTPPALPNSMSAMMQKAAKSGHLVLYLLALLALPISGWFWSSVHGSPIMVLGLFELPPLTTKNPDLYSTAKTIHFTLAFTCAAIVAGHILIALKHHFIDRDSVLASMMPHHKIKR